MVSAGWVQIPRKLTNTSANESVSLVQFWRQGAHLPFCWVRSGRDLHVRLFIAWLTWRWSVLPWRPWLSHWRLACKLAARWRLCTCWGSFAVVQFPRNTLPSRNYRILWAFSPDAIAWRPSVGSAVHALTPALQAMTPAGCRLRFQCRVCICISALICCRLCSP